MALLEGFPGIRELCGGHRASILGFGGADLSNRRLAKLSKIKLRHGDATLPARFAFTEG